MVQSLRSVSIAVGLAAWWGFNAHADVILEGETEYAVSSGTQTISDKVTGTGSIKKTGGGTLVLANAANDYSGGTLVEQGTLEVAAAGALGTGAVTNAAVGAYFTFTATPATTGGFVEHANDFVFLGADGNPDKHVIFYQNTKLTGDIVSSRRMRLRHNPKNTGSPGNGGPSSTFDGKIDLGSAADLYLNLYGTMTANGPIFVRNLYTGEAWSGGGKLHLYSPETRIANTLEVGQPAITCYDTNVLGYAPVVEWRIPGGVGGAGYSLIDLNGYDQTVGSVSFLVQKNSGWDENRYKASDRLCIKSTNPATLTLTGHTENKTAYASVRGSVSLVLDAQDNPGFVQTFAYSLSPFTGTTTVKAGTLRLTENARFSGTPTLTVEAGASFVSASTNSLPSLEGVKTLVVKGTFDASTARVNPFSDALTSVELAENAVLKLPAGTLVTIKSLKIGDQTYTAGFFTPAALPQLQGVSVVVMDSLGTMTWTGAGADENLSTLGNWDATPDLAFGSKKAVFATGGVHAVVDVDAVLGGLAFTAADGFTLARAENTPKPITLVGDIAATATAGRYVVDAPLKIIGDHKVSTTADNAITLKDAFSTDASMPGQLTLVGQDIRFAGVNVVSGGIAITTNRVTVTGLLATPGHAYEGRPESTTGVLYINLEKTKNSEMTGLCLSNAVVEKAVYVNNRIGATAIYAPANTTNEIKGFFRYVGDTHWEKFRLLSKSELTLSGGLETVHSFRVFDGGTLRIRNKPGSFLGSAGLNPNSGTVVLEVADNTFKYLCVGYTVGATAKVETTVDYAMTNGLVQVGGNGGSIAGCTALGSGTYTLDLHDTQQKCQKLAVLTKGILTGDYPAMLEVIEGRVEDDPEGYAVNGQVTGGVGLHLSGAGTLEFKAKTFASAGDLEVSNGTMSFLAGATWLNGTNVTVRGAGTLKLGRSDVFDGGKAVLHLGADDDTWKIDIPAGQCAAFSWAYDADGRQLPSGTYGAVGTAGVTRPRYAAHVTGGGTFRVRRHSTQILLR